MSANRYIFLLSAIALVLTGCGSRVPHATSYPMQTQRKMQAAKHWQVLAEDLAEQVKKCIAERKDLKVKPVYVMPKDETPFGDIFHDLLISKLVSGGVLVSRVEKEVLRMEYDVKLLEHSDRDLSKWPLKFTALGAGIMVARELSDWVLDDLLAFGVGGGLLADVALSHHAGKPSRKEVIITTSLIYGDYYFMHQSDIYYINDPDAAHYVKTETPQIFDSLGREETTDVALDPLEETIIEEDTIEAAPEDKDTTPNGRTFNVVD